jgi:hypothetical protein
VPAWRLKIEQPRQNDPAEPGQAVLFLRSFNLPIRDLTPGAGRFNFTAVWMMDASDSGSDLTTSLLQGSISCCPLAEWEKRSILRSPCQKLCHGRRLVA